MKSLFRRVQVHNSAGSELGRFDQKINLVHAYLQVVDPGFPAWDTTRFIVSVPFDCRLGVGRPNSAFFQYFWCSHIDTVSLLRSWDDVAGVSLAASSELADAFRTAAHRRA